MKNRTLAVILLLCTVLIPNGFAITTNKIYKNSSNFGNVEFVESDPKGEIYAIGALKMLADRFNELVYFLKKKNDNIELSANQQRAYDKDLKVLTFNYYDVSMKATPYSRTYGIMYARNLFKGLEDYIYHPMYMLMDPNYNLNFGWLTCVPTSNSNFPDMLDTFIEYINSSEKFGYFDDIGLCTHYLKKITRLKLEKILKIKNFYEKYALDSNNAMIMFENIIILIKKFIMRNDFAVKHLEFVVKYAKKQENRGLLLEKIKNIVMNNIECFANSVEEMTLVYHKIR